ncbi:MAG: tetratricopeptide repeat protein [Actinobacteria bacterium]|nr:tetratricopeptide repeat protein [Actinomycetota bacterium]
MLLDKRKVGLVTKIGALIIAFTFIVAYIPMITDAFGPGGDKTPEQQQSPTIPSLQKAVQKNPKDINAWIKLGDAFHDQNFYGEAIESYSKALELDPKNVDALINRSYSYFYLGQVDTATAEVKKGIEIDSNYAKAYYYLATFLSAQEGEAEEAIKAYKTYIELDPDGKEVQQAKEWIKVLEKIK